MGSGKSVLFADCEPTPHGTVQVDLPWLWSELAHLREWVRQRAAPGQQVDVEAVLLNVAAAVVAERPELGSTPPQQYLRAVAEKVMLAQAA